MVRLVRVYAKLYGRERTNVLSDDILFLLVFLKRAILMSFLSMNFLCL